ncbi:MAG: response regulator transcription factor [Acidimicrobiales bacterium]
MSAPPATVPSRAPRLLVIEDDAPIRTALEVAFRGEGYEVRAEADGAKILSISEKFRPDLAVVDVRLPVGPDGNQLVRQLRANGLGMPTLMLTAADRLEDRLEGFGAGADDYVIKPFLMAELLARVRALLRRSGALEAVELSFDDIVMDETTRTVSRGGRPLDLTRTEYELLGVLMRHPRQVLSKHQLLTQVWGFEAFEQNRVEVHMSALRRKLELEGPRVVQTVRGIGYILRS